MELGKVNNWQILERNDYFIAFDGNGTEINFSNEGSAVDFAYLFGDAKGAKFNPIRINKILEKDFYRAFVFYMV